MGGVSVPYPALVKAFESAAQSITAGGALTLAHGLGAKPELVQIALRCAVIDLGYAVGDDVLFPFFDQGGGYGCEVWADASNVNVIFSSVSPVFRLHNKTTGVPADITLASWRFVARGWV